MRLLSAILLIFTVFQGAVAHPLGSEAPLADQLTHQFAGLHHFPILLLVVVVVAVALRRLRKD